MDEEEAPPTAPPPPPPMGMAMGSSPNTAQVNPQWTALLAALQAEEHCPEVLAWQGEIVDSLTSGLRTQEQHIEEAMKGAGVRENLFSAPLYQMEVARVRYALNSYVRARLRKILKCAGHLDSEAWARLSPHEQTLCSRYLGLCARYHHAAFLQDLPPPFQEGDLSADNAECPGAFGKAFTRPPALDDFVFARVTKDLGEIVVDTDENDRGGGSKTTRLAEGDIHVLKYAAVRPLVYSGALALF
ncbi:hypothetical protein CTAYLR_000964 [Chrysophaeum taylorii]|uniref:DNA replication complex GINS protein SLD5 n=1 Tax=Chrysophaeum taylorii TaxID=2483200 RepID=A0AAD7XLI0_9STRA|nr:hypothetical protein CTAYLR_000964 [Chrysophaeum taylorii]